MGYSLWLEKGKILTRRNRLISCRDCPCTSGCGTCADCGGWPGFINSNNRYNRYEYRDWDCCLFGSHPVSEGGFAEVDGHVTLAYVRPCGAKIIESTGNYAMRYPVGTIYCLSGENRCSYPYPFIMNGKIISDTRQNDNIYNDGCCNQDGSRIYVIMWNDEDEEDFE